MNSKALIVGASGHGKVILEILQSMRYFGSFGFLDDNARLKGKKILGTPILGGLALIKEGKKLGFSSLFVAIGNNRTREKLQIQAESLGFQIPTAIHSKAVVSPSSKVGAGTCVMAGTIIGTDARVGKGCIINTASSIDHDNLISDFAQIMPAAHLAGTVRVGRRAYIGTGAIVLPNLKIVDDATIGAGAVVTKDVHTLKPLVGIPAKPLEK